MDYIDGPDVGEVLRRAGGRLDPRRAVRFIRDAAAGLDHAHEKKIVHRDVKPSNLLVSTVEGEERVLVADFGIARILDEEITVASASEAAHRDDTRELTLEYAAPEQFVDSQPDRRSDIYSLGATLYRLLTGSLPYPNRPRQALIDAHLREPAPVPSRVRPELPKAFDAVIAKAMAKDPADRYQTCGDLARAALAALSDEAVDPTVDDRTEPSTRTGPPNRHAEPGPPEEGSDDRAGTSGDAAVHRSRMSARGPGVRTLVASTVLAVAVALVVGRLAGGAEPEPTSAAAATATAFLTERCHWTVRHPDGDRTFVELPTGAEARDEPNCILNLGDRTAAVSAVQRAVALCHDIPLDISGVYDSATRAAIQRLQREAGAEADGIYGPRTRATVLRWPVHREADGGFEGRCRSLG